MYAWEAGEHEILEEDRACTCVQYHSTRRGGGLPGAPGKDLPQPGAPWEATIGVQIDH